jgi:hypothetical protein
VVDVLIMRHLGAVFSCSQDGVSVSNLEHVKLYPVNKTEYCCLQGCGTA